LREQRRRSAIISRLQDTPMYLDGHEPPQQMDRDDEQILTI
jgi:hypothetical protein